MIETGVQGEDEVWGFAKAKVNGGVQFLSCIIVARGGDVEIE